MTTTTTGKTILITGATAGIGRHAALHLARRGHRIIATGRRAEALASLRAEAERERLAIEVMQLDVTRPESIARASIEVDGLTDGRGVDVLINNAGYGQFGPLEMVSDADLRAQFETNVFGLMATTRAFLPAMRARGSGRIINLSSVGGRVTFPLGGAYHATKYAVEAMSDALRRELQIFGVDVVVIEPGAIRSEFAERGLDAAAPYRDASSPYARFVERAQAFIERADRMSVDPLVISKAITRAVESRRPRVRYVAPFSAKIMVAMLSRWLPARLVDALVLRIFGVRRGGAAPASSAASSSSIPPSKRSAA